jgi:carboxymethylenebutenolidase
LNIQRTRLRSPGGPADQSPNSSRAAGLAARTRTSAGVADDLAGAGFLTIAPEFYHRDAAPGHWLEHDDAGRQEGFGYLHRLRRDQALADVAASLQWLKSEPGIEQVAIVGFSAGGHLSYLAACRLPVSLIAVLYGGWLPSTDIPMSQPTPTLDLTPESLAGSATW